MQGALLSTVWVAAALFGVRILAIYSGSWLGAWLGGTPPEYRRKVWQGMLTQVRNRVCLIERPKNLPQLVAFPA